MATNFLKLNASKIEFAFVGAKGLFTKAILRDISIGERIIPAKSIAMNIGAVMDSSYGLQAYENMVGRSNCYHLLPYMDVSSSYALVTSKLDFPNGRLHGFLACQQAKLQHVQNTVARIELSPGGIISPRSSYIALVACQVPCAV